MLNETPSVLAHTPNALKELADRHTANTQRILEGGDQKIISQLIEKNQTISKAASMLIDLTRKAAELICVITKQPCEEFRAYILSCFLPALEIIKNKRAIRKKIAENIP